MQGAVTAFLRKARCGAAFLPKIFYCAILYDNPILKPQIREIDRNLSRFLSPKFNILSAKKYFEKYVIYLTNRFGNDIIISIVKYRYGITGRTNYEKGER